MIKEKCVWIIILASCFINCFGEEIKASAKFAKGPVDGAKFAKDFNAIEQQKLELSIKHFQKLVEWALVLRKQTIIFSQILQFKKEQKVPLTGKDLDVLQNGIQEHLQLREEILKVIYAYKPYDVKHDILNKKLRLTFDMFSLAGALVLYDNFAISIMTFQNDSTLRRLVNRGDIGFNLGTDKLAELLEEYHSTENREEVLRVLELIKTNRLWINKNKPNNKILAYLDELIIQSPSLQTIQSNNVVKKYSRYLGLFADKGRDKVSHLKETAFNEISKMFGNGIGLVQMRKGFLYDNKKIAEELKETLKPLDILLDQTPFRLTAKFIPGYFGHVAIWTGTPEELKELGLWDHPKIKPHQKDILAGKRILEALRDGVQLNTVEHFMDVDDIAILRLSQKIDLSEEKETMLRAFRQLDKEYDFNFDVETTDKIVCSELAYMVYTHIEWPTERTLGRDTISPDNVGYLAIGKSSPFELIKFYYKGKNLKGSADKIYKKSIIDSSK